MWIMLTILLTCAMAAGAVAIMMVRHRHATERCRHYLATIELWQHQGLTDHSVSQAQARRNLRRILAAASARRR